jgi:4,4'-diaponeurosporenoate glycosyltransferase
MSNLWTLFIISASVYGIAGTLLLWKIPKPGIGFRPEGTVSVIIPARNEEKRLPGLLASLEKEIAAFGPEVSFETIVVNDRSEDRTEEMAREYGVRVVNLGEDFPGRAGKSRACWAGVSEAAGDYFLFLDADTWFVPGGLEKIIGAWQRGLVSVQPFHRLQQLYETLSAYFNIIVMSGVRAFTPFAEPGNPKGCFGPCLFCSREEYMQAGGHKEIEDELVDDIALARLFKSRGLPVYCFGGKGSIEFRMYPGGLKELLEGWTKNMATGARFSAPLVNILLFIWIAGITNLFLSFRQALPPGGQTFLSGNPVQLIVTAGVYLLYVLQLLHHLRRIGSFPFYTALFFPLFLVFFIGVFFYSLFKTKIVKHVTWKGRRLHL